MRIMPLIISSSVSAHSLKSGSRVCHMISLWPSGPSVNCAVNYCKIKALCIHQA